MLREGCTERVVGPCGVVYPGSGGGGGVPGVWGGTGTCVGCTTTVVRVRGHPLHCVLHCFPLWHCLTPTVALSDPTVALSDPTVVQPWLYSGPYSGTALDSLVVQPWTPLWYSLGLPGGKTDLPGGKTDLPGGKTSLPGGKTSLPGDQARLSPWRFTRSVDQWSLRLSLG